MRLSAKRLRDSLSSPRRLGSDHATSDTRACTVSPWIGLLTLRPALLGRRRDRGRSDEDRAHLSRVRVLDRRRPPAAHERDARDRKSTRLNSSHGYISYAVFCLKKKKTLSLYN